MTKKNGYEGEYTKVFYTARETAKKLKMNYLKVIAICKKLGIRKDHSGFEIIKEDLKKIKSLI